MVNSAPCPSVRLAARTLAVVLLHDGLDDVQPQAARSLVDTCGLKRCSSISGAMPEPSSRTTISISPVVAPAHDLNRSALRAWRAWRSENRLISTRSQAQCAPQLDAGFHVAGEADLRSAAGDHGILDERDGVVQDLLRTAPRSRSMPAWMLAAMFLPRSTLRRIAAESLAQRGSPDSRSAASTRV